MTAGPLAKQEEDDHWQAAKDSCRSVLLEEGPASRSDADLEEDRGRELREWKERRVDEAVALIRVSWTALLLLPGSHRGFIFVRENGAGARSLSDCRPRCVTIRCAGSGARRPAAGVAVRGGQGGAGLSACCSASLLLLPCCRYCGCCGCRGCCGCCYCSKHSERLGLVG